MHDHYDIWKIEMIGFMKTSAHANTALLTKQHLTRPKRDRIILEELPRMTPPILAEPGLPTEIPKKKV